MKIGIGDTPGKNGKINSILHSTGNILSIVDARRHLGPN
jgi:hypothetical protein